MVHNIKSLLLTGTIYCVTCTPQSERHEFWLFFYEVLKIRVTNCIGLKFSQSRRTYIGAIGKLKSYNRV